MQLAMVKRRDPDNDWLAYFLCLWRHGGSSSMGRDFYVPSPFDIEQRKLDLKWMKRLGFPHSFITNVLDYENPSIDRVRQMVERHGPEQAYARCRPFLMPTEYDDEERKTNGVFIAG